RFVLPRASVGSVGVPGVRRVALVARARRHAPAPARHERASISLGAAGDRFARCLGRVVRDHRGGGLARHGRAREARGEADGAMEMLDGPRAAGWLRHFRSAAWLGWQVESNWADPYVFAVYALARPLALSLILVAIYAVVSGGQLHGDRFTWIYVGNAFFVFVPLMLVGVGWTVVEDREQFQVLKYVYCSPIGLFTYLAGRAVTKFVSATFSCLAILLVGALFLGVRYHTTPALAVFGLGGFALGVVGMFGMGLLLA